MNWALLGAEFARVLGHPWTIAYLVGMAGWGLWLWHDRDGGPRRPDRNKDGSRRRMAR